MLYSVSMIIAVTILDVLVRGSTQPHVYTIGATSLNSQELHAPANLFQLMRDRSLIRLEELHLDAFALSLEISGSVTDTISSETTEWVENDLFQYDGKRFDIVKQLWSHVDSGSRTDSYSRIIWNGEVAITFRQPGAYVQIDDDKNLIIGECVSRYIFSSHSGHHAGDNISFWQIASDSQATTVSLDEINGELQFLIEVKDLDHGSYKAWLDPQYEFAIRRIEIRKARHHLFYGVPLAQPIVSNTAANISRDPSDWVTVEYFHSIDVAEFQRLFDRWVPVIVTLHTKRVYESGRVLESTLTEKCTSIDIESPEFTTDAFEHNIPNGSKVFMGSNASVNYQWINNQIVPVIDEATLASIDVAIGQLAIEVDAASKDISSSNWFLWLIAGGGSLLAFTVSALYWMKKS